MKNLMALAVASCFVGGPAAEAQITVTVDFESFAPDIIQPPDFLSSFGINDITLSNSGPGTVLGPVVLEGNVAFFPTSGTKYFQNVGSGNTGPSAMTLFFGFFVVLNATV